MRPKEYLDAHKVQSAKADSDTLEAITDALHGIEADRLVEEALIFHNSHIAEAYRDSALDQSKQVQLAEEWVERYQAEINSFDSENPEDQLLNEAAKKSNDFKHFAGNILGKGLSWLRDAIVMDVLTNAWALLRRIIWDGGKFVIRRLGVILVETVLPALPEFILPALSIAGIAAVSYAVYEHYVKGTPFKDVFKTLSVGRGTAEPPLSIQPRTSERYNTPAPGAQTTAPTPSAPITVGPQAQTNAEQWLHRYRSQDVQTALHDASVATGVDEATLTTFAYLESRLGRNTGNHRAQGLMQFEPDTWAEAYVRWQHAYNLPRHMNINNVHDSALLGAIYLKEGVIPSIRSAVGSPNAIDLYYGWLLGPSGGAEFLRKLHNSPNAPVVSTFSNPAHIRNNPGDFFLNGHPLTYQQSYETISSRAGGIYAAVAAETRTQSSTQVAVNGNPQTQQNQPQGGATPLPSAQAGNAAASAPTVRQGPVRPDYAILQGRLPVAA
jgi:hypothetical protein